MTMTMNVHQDPHKIMSMITPATCQTRRDQVPLCLTVTVRMWKKPVRNMRKPTRRRMIRVI